MDQNITLFLLLFLQLSEKFSFALYIINNDSFCAYKSYEFCTFKYKWVNNQVSKHTKSLWE